MFTAIAGTEDFVETTFTGTPLDVGFNSVYLLNVLGVLDGANAVIKLQDNSGPGVFLDDGDDDALYVVMPMRV